MRTPASIVAILFALAAGPALADHSASPCDADVVTIDAGATALYLVLDDDGEVWLYAEANAHADLQRGGARWWEMGIGPVPRSCWDIGLATGEPIPDPDLIVV